MCGRVGQQRSARDARRADDGAQLSSKAPLGFVPLPGVAMLNRKPAILDKVQGKFANGEKVRI